MERNGVQATAMKNPENNNRDGMINGWRPIFRAKLFFGGGNMGEKESMLVETFN